MDDKITALLANENFDKDIMNALVEAITKKDNESIIHILDWHVHNRLTKEHVLQLLTESTATSNMFKRTRLFS